MGRVRDWFLEHPPSAWVTVLEGAVKLLNTLLLVLGVTVLTLSIITVVQIQNESGSGPPDTNSAYTPLTAASHPTTLPAIVLPHIRQADAATLRMAYRGVKILNVPWFIYAFGALGAWTALTAAIALLGTRLRSTGCLSSHIFFMCVLLTGQACAAVAFFVDAGWQQRLPALDEKLKKFLIERYEVCKWVGVGLFLLQLLTLLLSCALQSAYVAAEEAAEDADEEAAWRRRPLLAQQARYLGSIWGICAIT
eukprot:GHUV01019103.1.p1 GENE.GHUV01019103.1~~GHUV01019103.1.p1  ORF type:complete len:251 (+),score=59.53 GHUV01019103.1:394-1146(+)